MAEIEERNGGRAYVPPHMRNGNDNFSSDNKGSSGSKSDDYSNDKSRSGFKGKKGKKGQKGDKGFGKGKNNGNSGYKGNGKSSGNYEDREEAPLETNGRWSKEEPTNNRWNEDSSRGNKGGKGERGDTNYKNDRGGALQTNDRWNNSNDDAPSQSNARWNNDDEDVPAKENTAVRYNQGSQDIRNNTSYSSQDIRNRGASGGNSKPRNWFERPDSRLNYGNVEDAFDDIFPPKQKTGIRFEEYDKIPVDVSGDGCESYTKIERFSEARLADELFENVQHCGYERPTPIQKYSIPIIRAGRDLMACAQTGSGKTAAFLLPAIQSLLDAGPPGAIQGNSTERRTPAPVVLILAPTRELATQIFEEGRKFTYKTGIKCAVVYGGAPMQDQKREITKGVDVLVAAPGRLSHFTEVNWITLGYVNYLVLDEADRMLDMGFEPQVRQIVDDSGMGKYYGRNNTRQTMMFSATFQDDIQGLARDFLTDDYIFLSVGRVGSTNESIDQKVVYVNDEADKMKRLKRSIQELSNAEGLILVFVETKKGADVLERELWNSSINVTAIHGDRSQIEREEALKAFRSGTHPVLVATDVAARGLDIPNVSLVINFDMPKNIDDYVHRIGRTGRAGRTGTAIAYINEAIVTRDMLKRLYERLSEAKQDIPDWFESLAKADRSNYKGGSSKDRQVRDIRKRDGGKGGASYSYRSEEGSKANKARVETTSRVPTSSSRAAPARAAPAANDAWGASGADDAW